MIDEFRAAFQELIDASVATDPHPFPAAAHRVYTLVPHVPEEERELALEALAPILSGGHALPGVAADLSLIAGAMVETGTAPGTTGVEVVRLLRLMGKGAAVFLSAWERTGGGPPPDPDTVTAEAEERVAADLADAAPTATVCWWTIRRHGLAAKTMLGTAAVRAAIRADAALHAELVAISNQLSAALWEFDEVRALLRMAETTSAVVLDRASGRAFRVLFDGIGDNYQLHVLLADALIGPEGRGLAGERPDPRWTAAYRFDAPTPEARAVRSAWNLTAVDGSWIWNEGVPADIPAIEGERIVVLDPQPFPRTWTAARRHPQVPGWLEVEEELTSDEAFLWWRRVATTTSAVAAAPASSPAPQDPPAHRAEEPAPQDGTAPVDTGPGAAPPGFPTVVADDTATVRPALEEIRASAGPITPAAKRAPRPERPADDEPRTTADHTAPTDAEPHPAAIEDDTPTDTTGHGDADPPPLAHAPDSAAGAGAGGTEAAKDAHLVEEAAPAPDAAEPGADHQDTAVTGDGHEEDDEDEGPARRAALGDGMPDSPALVPGPGAPEAPEAPAAATPESGATPTAEQDRAPAPAESAVSARAASGAEGTGSAASGSHADDPAPAPVGGDTSPYGAATEVFPVITEEIAAMFDAEHAADEHGDDSGASDAAPGPEHAGSDDGAPGASFLPPLPPGVSDSSRWGPNWL